jgi:hypothetical protein
LRGTLGSPRPDGLTIVNLATARLRSFDPPPGITLGAPVYDASTGRVLVITSTVTLQFPASSPTPLPEVLPWIGSGLVLSPDGLYAYVCVNAEGAACTLRRRNDDVAIASLTSVREVLFDSVSGHIVVTRLSAPVRTVLTYSTASAPLQAVWSRTWDGAAPVAVDGTRIVLNRDLGGIGRLVTVDSVTGADLASADSRVSGLIAAGGGRVFLVHNGGFELQSYDGQTLAPIANAIVGNSILFRTASELAVAGDRVIVSSTSIKGGITSGVEVRDGATLAALPGGGGDFGIFGAMSVTGDPWCQISRATTSLEVPAAGGIAEIAVTASANCDEWGVQGGGENSYLLPPGVRTGSGLVQLVIGRNSTRFPRTYFLLVAGAGMEFRQVVETETPAAPRMTGVRISGAMATIFWEPPSSGPYAASGYAIEGGVAGGPVLQQVNAPATARSLDVPGLPPGTYFVQARGRNVAGTGAASPPMTFTIAPASPPQPPTALAVQVAGSTVRLTWNAPASGPSPAFYIIEGGLPGGPFGEVARTADSRTEFEASGVLAGSYQVRVRAANGAGQSTASAALAVMVAACARPPGAPGALRTIATGALTSLVWTAPSSGAERYLLEAQVLWAQGQPTVSVTTAATRLEVAAPVGNYIVRVRGQNACGTGAASPDAVIFVPSEFGSSPSAR